MEDKKLYTFICNDDETEIGIVIASSLDDACEIFKRNRQNDKVTQFIHGYGDFHYDEEEKDVAKIKEREEKYLILWDVSQLECIGSGEKNDIKYYEYETRGGWWEWYRLTIIEQPLKEYKEFIEKLREAAEKSLPVPTSYVGMGSKIYDHLAKMCLEGKLRMMPLSRMGNSDRGFVKALIINNCYGLASSEWWSVDEFPPVRKTRFDEDAFIKAAFKSIMYPGRGCMRSYALRWMQFDLFYKKFIEFLRQANETEPKMSLKAVVEWNKEYVNLYYINMKEVYKEWQDHSFCGATFAFELHIPTRSEAKAARVRTLRQLGLWFLDDITYNKNRYKGGDMMGLIHACMFGETYPSTKIGLNLDTTIHEKSQKWLENKNKKGK